MSLPDNWNSTLSASKIAALSRAGVGSSAWLRMIERIARGESNYRTKAMDDGILADENIKRAMLPVHSADESIDFAGLRDSGRFFLQVDGGWFIPSGFDVAYPAQRVARDTDVVDEGFGRLDDLVSVSATPDAVGKFFALVEEKIADGEVIKVYRAKARSAIVEFKYPTKSVEKIERYFYEDGYAAQVAVQMELARADVGIFAVIRKNGDVEAMLIERDSARHERAVASALRVIRPAFVDLWKVQSELEKGREGLPAVLSVLTDDQSALRIAQKVAGLDMRKAEDRAVLGEIYAGVAEVKDRLAAVAAPIVEAMEAQKENLAVEIGGVIEQTGGKVKNIALGHFATAILKKPPARVVIEAEGLIPSEYRKIDESRIRKSLAAGEKVPGARLEAGAESVYFRAQKVGEKGGGE